MPMAEPHSLQWFAIVDRADRVFARSVRATIACEGSRDICSLCGFPPTGDYQLVEAVGLKRSIPTLRLCDCCLTDRRVLGETLVPFRRGDRRYGAASPRGFVGGVVGFWKRVYRRSE